MLMPKRVKRRKQFRGSMRGKATRGNVISYGKLFTGLESMEEIKWVQELALEKNGVAAVKNDRGDILCQEDALSYVERFDIEFI